MAFDGITTKIVIKELNNTVLNSRVEKIYIPNRNEVWLHLHTQDRKNVKLLISVDANNCRFHLSNESRSNPEKAPQFCMVLRKYLTGAKLISISQIALDRIVNFTFETIDDFGDIVKMTLIVELMGKYSNIILTSNEKIIDSIRRVDITMSSVREVLPSKKYIIPSSLGKHDFLNIDINEFVQIVSENVSKSEFENISIPNLLSSLFVGFSKSFIQAVCDLISINNEFAKTDITKELLCTIYNKIAEIFEKIEFDKISLISNETGKDYYVIECDEKQNEFAISSFLDDFYSSKENVSLLKSAKQNLKRDINSHISKIAKKLTLVLKTLEDEPNLEKYKQYGEIISSNIYKMQIGMDKLVTENFYDNNNLITIPLQKNLTPSRNAQNYFKKYNKLKGSISHAKEYKASYEEELDYLNSVLFEIDEATSIFELDEIHEEIINAGYSKKVSKKGKKKDEPSAPLTYEFNGTKILVGRNNVQNDKLTLKIARNNYTWLHTKNIHGSHVIIESENVDDETLYYAATLAKEHSNGKNSSKVEVDYTLVKYVHKESGAKPGMVVYTDYKTIIV